MKYYDHFIIPFTIGVAVLFAIIIYKYIVWFWRLPSSDKQLVYTGIFTRKSFTAIGEVFSESLIHRRIFRTNPVLGYMHMSLAFGWFLLIFVGWIETTVHLNGEIVPMHTHVFFKFFAPPLENGTISTMFSFIMDLLLLFVLSGVSLALYKRVRSKALGMRKTTKHTTGDRIALSSLWFIFPARLVAESVTCGITGHGSFLTGGLGSLLVEQFGLQALEAFKPYAWWFYSVALGVFFISMPFSRYMHIFTEIPLTFLRKYGVRSANTEKSYDNFQLQACSRCGICIDPCQLQKDAGINNVQSVYFIRDRRYKKLTNEVADNCLMCGRCEVKCPVGLELNTLRLNSREKLINSATDNRFNYIKGADQSIGAGRVGYFAGCMTLLTPRILKAMDDIFSAAKENVWWADKDGGVCCGRPLKLSGELDAAAKMVGYNKDLFSKHGITTLVTSCPICLKVFREDYDLDGIEVLHHSEYILRLIEQGRIEMSRSEEVFTYHDPCELGRGSGIYDEPREVIGYIGSLVEVSQNREDAFCCGSSVANTAITDKGQNNISKSVCSEFAATGADSVVTACPLCKKAIGRNSSQPVYDLSEIVSRSLFISK